MDHDSTTTSKTHILNQSTQKHPTTSITITYENREIPARTGQTIAGAMYEAGVRIFSRSFKYPRPRGLLCAAGRCPNCMVNVNGEPNVRACMTPVEEGQEVAVLQDHALPEALLDHRPQHEADDDGGERKPP
ncbi:MAG TPA: (2Fe-2S)-binding protein, partial [candidate division Zixibacteria bacterium]|nr:(2Fe-2S)-binding protein [candidate division Zixibacteria bacterium]